MALNVLIVDDSPIMRKMIIKSLKDTGLLICDIFEAENGERGLAVLKKNNVDFVLLDLNMPVMDGEEMLTQVRQTPVINDVPIVIVSSETNDKRIELLVQKKSKFVHKPFSPKNLGILVKGLIKERKNGNGA